MNENDCSFFTCNQHAVLNKLNRLTESLNIYDVSLYQAVFKIITVDVYFPFGDYGCKV